MANGCGLAVYQRLLYCPWQCCGILLVKRQLLSG